MVKTKAGETIGTRVFLRLKGVKAKTGLPESTIYYLQAKGEFPRSVKLSERVAAWDESEIDGWMAAKLAARDQAAA
jgi:prophage regulatory protein